MAAKLIKMCSANYPSYGESNEAKGMLWMQTFQKESDDLMQTAIISCLSYCKKFPTIAEIKEAIKDLQYEEQTKPKIQLPWDMPREINLAQKAREFVQSGKAKEYLQSIDITKLVEYAKVHFPSISNELVLKNYNEFSDGLKQLDQCFSCRMMKQTCDNMRIKHELSADGFVKNLLERCQKVDRRV